MHATWEALVCTGQSISQTAHRAHISMLRAAATADPSQAELPTKITILDNDIPKGDYDLANKISIEMSESEKTEYGNEWRTYQERNANLENHRVQAYSLILGKYTQLLQGKTKQDTAWNTTRNLYNALVLLQLIEKTALEQT